MRPALRAKFGSRGKIQQRCCQGRIASWLSQRQTVLSLMLATIPALRASITRSATLHLESGRSCTDGSSQARALICTTTSGGKSPRTPWAGKFFEPKKTLLEKALAPHANDFPTRVESFSDLVIGEPVGGAKNDLGAQDLEIR